MLVKVGSHYINAERVANISPASDPNSCFINFLDNKEIWVKADIGIEEVAKVINKSITRNKK